MAGWIYFLVGVSHFIHNFKLARRLRALGDNGGRRPRSG
jgi:hypothetical protein